MERINSACAGTIVSVALATAVGLGGTTISLADVTLTSVSAFTKVDNQYGLLEEMYERFHEQNPDITIEFDFLAHDAYHTKMQALAIAGTLPNIMTLWPGKRTGYLTDTGYIRDLRDLVERDDIAASQKEIFLAPQGKNGEIYELAPPFVNYSNIVYANTQLMDELGLTYPETLEEFHEQAATIQAAGYRPVVYGDQSSWVLQSCLLSMLTGRVGGLEWFKNAQFGTNGAGFDDEEFVRSLQIVQDMVDSGLISKSEPSTTREQAMSAFVSGKSVYLIGGIWEVANLETSLPEEMKSKIAMFAFPSIAGERESSQSSSGALNTGMGISAASTDEEVEAAWKWIKFNADFANADLVVKYGQLPVYKNGSIADMIDSPLSQASFKFSSAIETVLPVIDDKMDAEGVNEIINAGLQELVLGEVTPEELAAKYETWVAANDSNRQ